MCWLISHAANDLVRLGLAPIDSGDVFDKGTVWVTVALCMVPVAQLDSASVSGAEGCRFEPCRGRYLGWVQTLRQIPIRKQVTIPERVQKETTPSKMFELFRPALEVHQVDCAFNGRMDANEDGFFMDDGLRVAFPTRGSLSIEALLVCRRIVLSFY